MIGTRLLAPLSWAIFLVALPVATAMAQDNCDPPHLVADAAIYGGPTTAIEAALPDLQARFDDAFRAACEKAKATPIFEENGQPATAINLLNAPEANVLSIYEMEPKTVVLEYPFEIDGGLSDLPAGDEFTNAIVCGAGLADKFKLDETACMVD